MGWVTDVLCLRDSCAVPHSRRLCHNFAASLIRDARPYSDQCAVVIERLTTKIHRVGELEERGRIGSTKQVPEKVSDTALSSAQRITNPIGTEQQHVPKLKFDNGGLDSGWDSWKT
ncbi:hypothetical protein BN975_02128 [Mycolicibacterium farcinogenes]|uniref:Uncharacterized protein n=1 Tax=Mycolicibacterium senegalense TaxID=1796 RepID=A0A378W3V6_9MYCO|nr:hypothetical protein BN975_02128 [Mycolicibacterium farcinogenes]SUA27777.1 Uncharacterised protein [Mycolicibacterium senegalense]